jgi:hypothetical protein
MKILTSVLEYLLFSQNVIFSGHLGKVELDAVALSNSVSIEITIAYQVTPSANICIVNYGMSLDKAVYTRWSE